MNNSNFICKAPWVSIAFQPSGQAGPCCVYELDNLKEVTVPIENTFKQEREEFLNGTVPLGCKKCHYSFLETGKSAANSFDRYPTDFKEVNIQEINVKANNICNLACRSCGPHFSSKWEEEFGKTVIITKDSLVLEKLKLLDLKKIKKVIVAGGEPTLTQEHVDLLQTLIAAGRTDIEIRIATNLTNLKYKQVDLISLWQKFHRLHLQLSIDAVEDHAKNIRSGTDWKIVTDNLRTVIRSGILYHINLTVSALNIWFLEETLIHLKNNYNIKNINFSILLGPELLSIQVIPTPYRKDLNQLLDRCTDLGYNLEQVKTYFNNTNKQHLWSDFLIYNLILDQSRKETFFESLPIKKDLIDRWIKV
jgi:sulfatase maturation enzyme AslB (radical SAM superfamily)